MKDWCERASRYRLKLIGSAFFRFASGLLIKTRFAKVRFDSIRFEVSLPTRHANCTSSNKRVRVHYREQAEIVLACEKEDRRSGLSSMFIGLCVRVLLRRSPTSCHLASAVALACSPSQGEDKPASVAFGVSASAFHQRCVSSPPCTATTAAMQPWIGIRLFATNPWMYARALLHLKGPSSCHFDSDRITPTYGLKVPRC